MKVFKFGGASVKDAASVRNVAEVLRRFPEEDLVVVVSAMGKTTNALERLTQAHLSGNRAAAGKELAGLESYHFAVTDGLDGAGRKSVEELFSELRSYLERNRSKDYDYVYDQIVSYGELVSTRIVSEYLGRSGIGCVWQDARKLLRTDSTWRDARIDWKTTRRQVRTAVTRHRRNGRKNGRRLILTQGFIGSTADGKTVTLGREGSDYTAAILAHALDAEEVTIWKDVPGVLSADPKWFEQTELLPLLSYRDAIELAYYGATVIHPRTIQPLENKHIPLRVRSFLRPDEEGTLIGDVRYDRLVPSFIFRIDQVFIAIAAPDLSFIVEENLSEIFRLFARHRVKINVMQNSAVSFSVSVDNDARRIPPLLKDLAKQFRVTHHSGRLELITIRYYDQQTIDRVCKNKEVLLEQKGKTTVQLVVKDVSSLQ